MEEIAYRDYVQINKEMDRVYHEMAVRLGLSDSALALLFTLWEEGDGLTPSQLYAEWSLSKQTGHSALAWLEDRGLVRLEPGRGDRRSKGVSLTLRGYDYAQRTVALLGRAEEAAFGALTQEEQEALLTLTGKMLCKLKEEMAECDLPAREDIL